MYGSKIRAFRMLRGYTQEYMADALGVEQSTYSRIETNQQKLTTDMLEGIAKALGVTIADISSNEPVIIQNNASNQGTQIGHNENFYADQKELYEKLIAAKDKEIERLTKQVEDLMKLLGKMG
jgi:transcriptional regulator with XRE-family HTH domain